MNKILLVEDDKSLREIYAVRLIEEGYDIVSAGDGEQALAMAIKERPVLIISDVMMPKISGFDMLDILRSTTETKDIRVIIMTALSSEDQRSRGEQLGADKYLVKSQVGIEDVVRAVHEVLRDTAETEPASVLAAAEMPVITTAMPVSTPATPTPIAPVVTRPVSSVSLPPRPMPEPLPSIPVTPTPTVLPQPATFAAPTTPTVPPNPTPIDSSRIPPPVTPVAPQPVVEQPVSAAVSTGSSSRVIEPLSSLDNTGETEALAAKISQELNIGTDPQPSVLSVPPSVSLPTPPPPPLGSSNDIQVPPAPPPTI